MGVRDAMTRDELLALMKAAKEGGLHTLASAAQEVLIGIGRRRGPGPARAGPASALARAERCRDPN